MAVLSITGLFFCIMSTKRCPVHPQLICSPVLLPPIVQT